MVKSQAVLQTMKHVELPYKPAILLLDIYSREKKIYFHVETYTWMFISVSF